MAYFTWNSLEFQDPWPLHSTKPSLLRDPSCVLFLRYNSTFSYKSTNTLCYSIRSYLIHGKCGTIPMLHDAPKLQLLQNDATVLFFHSQAYFRNSSPATGSDFLYRDHATSLPPLLCSNRGVVGAGNPTGIFALHPCLADKHLDGVVEHMPHVQNPVTFGGGITMVKSLPLIRGAWKYLSIPMLIPPCLCFGRTVSHWNLCHLYIFLAAQFYKPSPALNYYILSKYLKTLTCLYAQQGFVNRLNHIFDVVFVCHFYRGVHVPKQPRNQHRRYAPPV